MPPTGTTARVFAILVCVTAVVAQSNLKEGQECLASSGDKPAWTCKLRSDCFWGKRLINATKLPPPSRLCRPSGWNQVVCCPPYEVPDWEETGTKGGPSLPPSPFTSTIPTTTNGKAAAKCKEYSKVLVVESIFLTDDLSSVNICSKVTPTITGGENAEPVQFPHMALIGFGSPPKFLCGGTLISDRFILSAAHCENHPRFGDARFVRLGDLNINSDQEDAAPETFGIEQIYVHPDYKAPSTYHDIMLIKLDKKVSKFSSYIRPLCLQVAHEIPYNVSIATGWGMKGAALPTSDTLQLVELPQVDAKRCHEVYEPLKGSAELPKGIDDRIQFCAGGKKGQDTCLGDSGGPLQTPIEGMDCMFSQIAVVSFGKNFCGEKDNPGVYVRVSAYVPWIESIVWG